MDKYIIFFPHLLFNYPSVHKIPNSVSGVKYCPACM